jgi:DNA repair protein RadA/Sms
LDEEREEPTKGDAKNRFAGLAKSAPAKKLSEVETSDVMRLCTGIGEFDRAFGGGLVEGGVVLIGGDPGIGKSTLLLQVVEALSRQLPTLYVSGEESVGQISLRAKRLGLDGDQVMVMAEISLEATMAAMEKGGSRVVVIDSLNTMFSEELSSAPGSVSQMRECAVKLTRYAKSTGTSIVLVAHMTKDDSISGPRVVEHVTDAVAILGGDTHSPYRILRCSKNRFGPVGELGVFHMGDRGMVGVTNPSAIFLAGHDKPVPGTCVMATMEGSRPLLVEIQALVDEGGPSPRRLSLGLERDRLAMLLAVLNKHGGVKTSDQDVFVNAVGGVIVKEPGADIAVLLAIQSSLRGRPMPQGVMAFGEVGLAGEVRPAAKGQERLREAAKLGFSVAIVPKANAPKKEIEGMTVHGVDRIEDALELAKEL